MVKRISAATSFFILTLTAPAWANYIPTPSIGDPGILALIALGALVVALTEFGGGYEILKTKKGKLSEYANVLIPVLALVGIVLALNDFEILIPVSLVFGSYALIRSFKLFFWGIKSKREEYLSGTKQWRLLTAGTLLLIFSLGFLLPAYDAYNYLTRPRGAYDSDTKANLHNLYLACKAYWADTSPANNCGLAKAKETTYGFIQSSKVTVIASPTVETEFTATAQHESSANILSIEADGNIKKR